MNANCFNSLHGWVLSLGGAKRIAPQLCTHARTNCAHPQIVSQNEHWNMVFVEVDKMPGVSWCLEFICTNINFIGGTYQRLSLTLSQVSRHQHFERYSLQTSLHIVLKVLLEYPIWRAFVTKFMTLPTHFLSFSLLLSSDQFWHEP